MYEGHDHPIGIGRKDTKVEDRVHCSGHPKDYLGRQAALLGETLLS